MHAQEEMPPPYDTTINQRAFLLSERKDPNEQFKVENSI